MRGSHDQREHSSDADADSGRAHLFITQLAEYEAAIQEWLVADPEMGKRTLVQRMLSEKGCHVKSITAQHYINRLRRPVLTPKRRARRSMRGSSIVPKLSREQLESYMPNLRHAFEANPSMTQPTLKTTLAELGVAVSKSTMHHLWLELKNEYYTSRQEPFRMRHRIQGKQNPMRCNLGHSEWHHIEAIIRAHMAKKHLHTATI